MTTATPVDDFALAGEGVTLACHRYGADGGTPLVMVHGAGVDSSFFSPMAGTLGRVRTVVTYDRRGYGNSGDPVDGDWSTDAQVGDLAAVCERVGGGAPVVLVGHSLGGGIALRLAARRPALVDALVLHEPFGLERPDPDDPIIGSRGQIAALVAEGRTARATALALQLQGPQDPRARPLTDEEASHVDRNMATMVTRELALPPEPFDLTAAREALGSRTLAVGLGELGGATSRAARVAPDVATALGCPLVAVPGAHNGPRDLPLEFASLVEGLLRLRS